MLNHPALQKLFCSTIHTHYAKQKLLKLQRDTICVEVNCESILRWYWHPSMYPKILFCQTTSHGLGPFARQSTRALYSPPIQKFIVFSLESILIPIDLGIICLVYTINPRFNKIRGKSDEKKLKNSSLSKQFSSFLL